MLKQLKQPKHVVPVGAGLLLLVLAATAGWYFLRGSFPAKPPPLPPPPLVELDGKSVAVSEYQYLGSWPIVDGYVKTGKGQAKGRAAPKWWDSVRLTFDDTLKAFHIEPGRTLLKGSVPRQMSPDTEEEAFQSIQWRDNQMSIFAFRALSPSKGTVVVEIDTDNTVVLYVNKQFIREVSAADNVELGTNLLIPVKIEAGENVIMVKVFSNEGPPRFRMGLTLDQSKDFQAARSASSGFLRKLMLNKTGDAFETPAVKWNALLGRMTVGVEVRDILNGRSLFEMDTVRSGNLIRDGGKVLGEGIYKITYKSLQPEQETFEECFLVGVPKKTFNSLTKAIDGLPWSDAEKLNVEAQMTRAEILLKKRNYKPGDKEWEQKILWTLGNLAEFVNLKKVAQAAEPARRISANPLPPANQHQQSTNSPTTETQTARDSHNANAGDIQRAGSAACATNIFKDMTGLRLRGYVSKIDNSKQFYRLYTPKNHKAGEKLPLLLIMPTPLGEGPKPFLASPFISSHRQAVQVGEFAEKHGFAVLWPGYRGVPDWWTYESAHAEEALRDVEKHYPIDRARVSLYGTCAGGIFAGRLASIYPNRFAAIVYDRAYFNWVNTSNGEAGDPMDDWVRAINPADRIIANKNLKILVLNDGTRTEQHGPMSVSRKFLEIAQAKRSDIKYSLGQRRMGVGLWNSVFEFLAGCKNEQPDNIKIDVPAASGYAGPISEVFATPFIVVEGTRAKPDEADFIHKAVTSLQEQYRTLFYNAEFVLKKDTEVTDEDIEKFSLVLVGNAESNATWGRLASRHGGRITPYEPVDEWLAYPAESVFAEVFKNPSNKKTYLLLIGADKLENLTLLKDFNPFTAWFDSYVLKHLGEREREYVTARKGR